MTNAPIFKYSYCNLGTLVIRLTDPEILILFIHFLYLLNAWHHMQY